MFFITFYNQQLVLTAINKIIIDITNPKAGFKYFTWI